MSSVQALDDFDDLPPGKIRPSLRMTEEEFVAWADEDTRAEWVDGEAIVRAPESGEHSNLGWRLQTLFKHFMGRRDLGEARGPNFMLRLPNQRRRRVPDLLFVTKDHFDRLRPNHLEGAPDLCIEMVSPDSQSRDRREKYLEYEQASVWEYWIVDPVSRNLEAYALDASAQAFGPILIDADERIPSTVLPGFYLRAASLFDAKLPAVIAILRELGIQP